MYDSIQLTKTVSSHTTSQVTWPNENKAFGNCFHALLAGLRPASFILARRIAFPLVLLGAGLALIQPCAGQSGTWTATGSLNTARVQHTATLLPNGKVLVAGGAIASGLFSASAELYDPASGTWTATGSLNTARFSHTATLLPNGMVLVAGGFGSHQPHLLLASAELYDPASGTWTATGSLSTARDDHTATLLPNGKVLVAGGDSVNFRERGTLRPGERDLDGHGQPQHRTRYYHTATLLPNGKVLVAGGSYQRQWSRERGTLRSGERDLDCHGQPQHRTRIITRRPCCPTARCWWQGDRQHRLALASAELYDPASGTWTATGSLSTARSFHTATLLPNGNVLVAGGVDNGSRERGTIRPGDWDLDGHGQPQHRTL